MMFHSRMEPNSNPKSHTVEKRTPISHNRQTVHLHFNDEVNICFVLRPKQRNKQKN